MFTSFYQVRIQESSITEIILTKITKYLDLIKSFSKNALILSTHAGTSVVGGEGITFYCNNPTPPTTKQMRYELSSQTLRLLNDYLKNYPVSEPLMIIDIENFTCVDTPVEGLEQGLNDENFTVNAYGSNIRISSKENNVSSMNEIFELIPENRFWFLYRKLRDWAYLEGWKFEKRVCDCLTYKFPKNCRVMHNCKDCSEFEECFKNAINETAKDMEDFINDPNVECSGKPTCCYGEKERCVPGAEETCGKWDGSRECNTCDFLPSEELCIEKIGASPEKSCETYEKTKDMISFGGETEEQKISKISFSPEEICGGYCVFYEAGYVNVKAQFTCTDKKYQLSLPFPEDRYLKFTIDTKISLQRRGINYQQVPCGGIPPNCVCVDEYCGEPHCEVIPVPPTTVPTTTPVPTTPVTTRPVTTRPPTTIPPPPE
jgi:hypothetical protein